MLICPSCGAQSPEGAIFCDECGASLKITNLHPTVQGQPTQVSPAQPVVAVPGVTYCPVCGAPAQADGAFCENCGASLAPDTPQPNPTGVKLPPTVAIPDAQASSDAITAPGKPSSSEQPTVPPSLQPRGLTCTNCGAILEQDSAFCDMCGTPVKVVPQAANQLPPEPVSADVYKPVTDVNVNPDATFVGGYENQQEYSLPQVEPPRTKTYEATQVSDYTPASDSEQPDTPGLGQPELYKQPAYTPPSPLQGRFAVRGTNVSLRFPSGKTDFIVGREDPIANIYPDIDLTDYGGDESGVSRQHARITLQGNQYYIIDLNSTNFTYLNQQRLQPNLPTPMHDGDEITLGKLKMLFYC